MCEMIKSRLLITEEYGISRIPLKLDGYLISPTGKQLLCELGIHIDRHIINLDLIGTKYNDTLTIEKAYIKLCNEGYINDIFIPHKNARIIGEYVYTPLVPYNLNEEFQLYHWSHIIVEEDDE